MALWWYSVSLAVWLSHKHLHCVPLLPSACLISVIFTAPKQSHQLCLPLGLLRCHWTTEQGMGCTQNQPFNLGSYPKGSTPGTPTCYGKPCPLPAHAATVGKKWKQPCQGTLISPWSPEGLPYPNCLWRWTAASPYPGLAARASGCKCLPLQQPCTEPAQKKCILAYFTNAVFHSFMGFTELTWGPSLFPRTRNMSRPISGLSLGITAYTFLKREG